ncbi:uncharacterized protein SPAPADRAFT_131769 [Spathaspora passalidarum NRRL Y-27907]|uniref:Uncharacterized protein n=1 Tax=Spathaspora passalidarum (strain NRRL Y-27907 / 11-Y1) TaxID=619300 RepID=G3AEN8_SPAPN|nr:uncharacterized protein SPAPADRAFT_131769 [Spathaspora passalidarum NRRL Y-27907]EGW35664.1 hypothetical protein SPAPADRAFT_131769 [Spathaspora passalidarum NRRL Y-27907]
MVLLGEIVQSQQYFSRLTTGIPSLDQIFITGTGNNQSLTNKIYDFQTAPSCQAMYLVTSSLIMSHLSNEKSVIIIDTLNRFPMKFIIKHPSFKKEWLNDKLMLYDRDTFSKLYAFFIYKKDIPKNCMIIINDFHDLVELYKLEMSSVYEELLLKHHIDMNDTYLHNKKTADNLLIPELPFNSDLIKVSPIAKFESHVKILFSKLIQICITQMSPIFLLGHLDTKFQPYRMKPTSQANSSQSSLTEKGRVVLTPHKFEKISTRIVFYNDWYHKTPHFDETVKSNFINENKLRMVSAARLELPKQKLMHHPVYFAVDDKFYHDKHFALDNKSYSLIDLSASTSDPDTDVDIPSSPIEYESVLDVSASEGPQDLSATM